MFIIIVSPNDSVYNEVFGTFDQEWEARRWAKDHIGGDNWIVQRITTIALP